MSGVIRRADFRPKRPRPAMAGRNGPQLRCRKLQQAASRSLQAAEPALNSGEQGKIEVPYCLWRTVDCWTLSRPDLPLPEVVFVRECDHIPSVVGKICVALRDGPIPVGAAFPPKERFVFPAAPSLGRATSYTAPRRHRSETWPHPALPALVLLPNDRDPQAGAAARPPPAQK